MRYLNKLTILTIFFSVGLFAQHSNTLNWQWSQGTGGVANNFSVKRATVSGGPYATLSSTVPVTTLTYVDTAGLIEGTKYYYVITATGPGGESVPSNEASGTVPFLPAKAPSNLSVVSQ